jgi:dephospho-CoA kinase
MAGGSFKAGTAPVIGLTGGAGSGKSRVAAMLRRRGARVVDADRLGHRLLRRTSPCYNKIVKNFGRGILGKGGAIDRGRLGELVFSVPGKRRTLNCIVHPALVRTVRQRISKLSKAGAKPIVLDAALLADWGLHREMDRVVMVDAPVRLRLRRLEAKGVPRERAKGIMAAQMPSARLKRLADEVIENSGTVALLEKRAGAAWCRMAGHFRQKNKKHR